MNNMFGKNNFKSDLIDALLDLSGSTRHSETDISVRCHICGDSIKQFDHGHLHININEDDDSESIFYHCYRCDASGILTSDDIRDILKDETSEFGPVVHKYNKKVIKKIKTSLGINKEGILPVSVPIPKDIITANNKKKYLDSRLGVNISIEDYTKFKVIFKLSEFLIANGLGITCKEYWLKVLDENYVGFLNTTNMVIIFRCIKDDKKLLRYYKYKVVKKLIDNNKIYAIPNKIDLMSIEDIEINLTEGPLDILSCFINLNNMSKKNKVYASMNGCSYKSTIKYFVWYGLFGDNITVNIYSDQDKPITFYKDMIEELKPLVGNINMIYNIKSKDIGVPKNEIDLKVVKIK